MSSSKTPKQVVLRIQKSSDQALSEQRNLVRCLLSARTCLQKWPQASEYTIKTLKSLQARRGHMFKRIVKNFDDLHQSMKQVISAYDDAASYRVAISDIPVLSKVASTKNNNKTIVTPLELLCKGGMGDKISFLINSLKLFVDNIDGMYTSINEMKGKLQEDTHVDVGVIDDLVSNLSIARNKSDEVLHL